MLLRTIIKLSISTSSFIAATFKRKTGTNWRSRYIRHYVLKSLARPNSYFMLTGPNNTKTWFPSGVNLIKNTNILGWAKHPNYFETMLSEVQKAETSDETSSEFKTRPHSFRTQLAGKHSDPSTYTYDTEFKSVEESTVR